MDRACGELEKHLKVLTEVIQQRDELAKSGKTFTEEQTNNYLQMVEEKKELEAAIGLLKSGKANFYCGGIQFIGDRLMRCVDQCERCKTYQVG